MGRTMTGIALALICLLLWSGRPASAQEDALLQPELTPEEVFETQNFYLRYLPNYARAHWVFRQDNHHLIGFAPYDAVNRRWTLISLGGKYCGYIQTLIGDERTDYSKHLAWYGRENQYKGFFVSRLGGRPITPDLPYGELGGEWIIYHIGNFPLELPTYWLEVDPLRRFTEGIDVSPVRPPSEE